MQVWLQLEPGNTKGGSIIVPLTSCLTGLDQSVLQMKTIIVSCHTVVSKPVKMEVNGTLILPPLVFPAGTHLINLFGYQFTCTFCKIAPFNIGNIFSVAQKWPSLQKRMSKFTQSFLYRIGSRNKVVTHAAFTRPILLCVLSRENAG